MCTYAFMATHRLNSNAFVADSATDFWYAIICTSPLVSNSISGSSSTSPIAVAATTTTSPSTSTAANAPLPRVISGWNLLSYAFVDNTTVAYYCASSRSANYYSWTWATSMAACESIGWQLADLKTATLWNAAVSLNQANTGAQCSASKFLLPLHVH
jgi:hypothetical protein